MLHGLAYKMLTYIITDDWFVVFLGVTEADSTKEDTEDLSLFLVVIFISPFLACVLGIVIGVEFESTIIRASCSSMCKTCGRYHRTRRYFLSKHHRSDSSLTPDTPVTNCERVGVSNAKPKGMFSTNERNLKNSKGRKKRNKTARTAITYITPPYAQIFKNSQNLKRADLAIEKETTLLAGENHSYQVLKNTKGNFETKDGYASIV